MDLVSPQLYRDHMIEVKRRIRAIDRILGAKKPRTLTAEFDNEFMWLQLRQIVELVAYSAIAADEERYAALRQEQDKNADYRIDSKAAKVLKHLSQISPHFLPKSLGGMVPRSYFWNARRPPPISRPASSWVRPRRLRTRRTWAA